MEFLLLRIHLEFEIRRCVLVWLSHTYTHTASQKKKMVWKAVNFGAANENGRWRARWRWWQRWPATWTKIHYKIWKCSLHTDFVVKWNEHKLNVYFIFVVTSCREWAGMCGYTFCRIRAPDRHCKQPSTRTHTVIIRAKCHQVEVRLSFISLMVSVVMLERGLVFLSTKIQGNAIHSGWMFLAAQHS